MSPHCFDVSETIAFVVFWSTDSCVDQASGGEGLYAAIHPVKVKSIEPFTIALPDGVAAGVVFNDIEAFIAQDELNVIVKENASAEREMKLFNSICAARSCLNNKYRSSCGVGPSGEEQKRRKMVR